MCVILHFFVGNLFHFWFTDLDSESMKKSNRFFFFCFFGDFFPIFFVFLMFTFSREVISISTHVLR